MVGHGTSTIPLTVMNLGNTVAYTNIDTVTPPTGVILHFAPVLLAFAAAFGGCLVFFRRKRI